MEQFPGNSQKARAPDEPRRKIEAVTSAEAIRRKRSISRRFKDAFIMGDPRAIAEGVVLDILIPEFRNMLSEAGQSAIERLIHGESARPQRRRSGYGYGHPGSGYPEREPRVSYNAMYPTSSGPPQAAQSRALPRRPRRQHFDDLLIPTRSEALEVIDQMFDILSRYGQVNVAELHSMVGMEPSHTDFKWGWRDLRGSKAVPVRNRDGTRSFLLDLPEPQPLD